MPAPCSVIPGARNFVQTLSAEPQMCGDSREHALRFLKVLEDNTR